MLNADSVLYCLDRSLFGRFKVNCGVNAWAKVFRIIPEFRILRLTFHRKSASKCLIKQVMIASLIYLQLIKENYHFSLKLLIYYGQCLNF